MGITLAREAIGEHVARIHVSDRDFVGELYMPPGAGRHPGVAVFPGSEGGLDSQAATAGLLASHGYAAVVVGYFGVEGLESDLADIPLERFAAGIRWLREQPSVDAGRVAALAVSKGSEGLLAAAAHLDDVELAALVVVSPSHVVWQAIGEHGPSPDQSSWTLAGAPLAYAPLDAEAIMPQLLRDAVLAKRDRRRHRPTLLHLVVSYSLDDDEALARARIPVERIGAPLLCLYGEADELWPSPKMTAAIVAARAGASAAAGDEHRGYRDCGHLIRMPYFPTAGLWTHGVAFGGTPAGLAAAQADAGPRILAFLDAHIGKTTAAGGEPAPTREPAA